MRDKNTLKSATLFYSLTLLIGFFVWIGSPSAAHADTGLVAKWAMDDGSGSTATDSSGNGNNATINGTATWVPGKIAGALSFDGSTNYAHLSTFNVTPTSTMTLCSWVKTSSASAQTIIGFGRNPGAFGNEGMFTILANGTIQFWDHTPPTGTYGFSTTGNSSTGIVNDGHWHLACFVKNNTAGTYYIDGIASGVTTAVVDIAYDNTDWTLGKDYRDNDSYFNGLMDDMRVYNIALTPSQLASLYGIEGYWKFDEGSGAVANDSSGNNNTGTIVGGPSWTTGRTGSALNFGNNQYVSIGGTPISSAIASSGQMTATAWVYVNSATASGTIMKSWPLDSNNDQFQLGFQGSTGIISGYIEQSNGTIIGPVQATTSLPLNSWHHIALTANGSSTLLYIDGNVVASTTYNGTIHQGGNYIGIGANLNNTGSPSANPGYFNGIIDDAHVYNRGLLPEEILTLMEVLPSQVVNLQATGTYSSGFSLTWNPNQSIDNVTDYVVQYSTDAGNTWNTVDTGSTSTSYLLNSVGPGDYFFRVKAVNVVGQGIPSNQAEINSPGATYTLGNDCLALEHITNTPGDAYGHYVMSADIDCSVVPNFTSINFPGAGFGGIFDAAGHTISNLYISTSTTDYVGLFSKIQNGATVKDLTLSHANVTSAGSYSGILAGYSNGTLQNVSVSGTSTGAFYVGGLIGQNDTLGTISNSSAHVSVVGNNPSNGSTEYVGGFAGDNEGSIDHSYSSGIVTNAIGSDSFYYVGGFIGYSGVGVLSYDYATVPIIVNLDSSQRSYYIGGFVGQAGSAVSIDHSYATGNITDQDDYAYEVGGFIGESSATLTNDYATGNISINTDGGGEPYYMGGFVGGGDAGPITGCYATGSITSNSPETLSYIGGFAGYNENPISSSYSTGDVEGNNDIGGFSGWSNGILSEVFASGNVTLFGSNPEYAGGLIGDNYSEIDDAYATGNITLDSGVTGTLLYIGGLLGYNSDGSIHRTYASGSVSTGTSSSDVGGLIGGYEQDVSSLTNSYSVGTVTGVTNVGGLVGLQILDSSGNPLYGDLAWYPGSASNAVGDFQMNGGSTDNGPIVNLSTGGYGTDEATVSNFYSTTEPVYAQGQGGAWDFSSLWQSHTNAYPTFQWYTPPMSTSTSPTLPTTPASSGGYSGGSTVMYGCKDPNASNYNYFSASDSSLCKYATSTILVSGQTANSAAQCISKTYPTKSIKFGANNDPAQVILLEQYLNTYENAKLPVTGTYSLQDRAAVITWQEKYASEILTPWHLTNGTGYVYTTSLLKFKNLFLAQCQKTSSATSTVQLVTQASSIARDLQIGMSGNDVRSLQQALISKNVGVAAKALSKNGVTDYFGQLTKSALAEFQKSAGIVPASGYYGSKTRAALGI